VRQLAAVLVLSAFGLTAANAQPAASAPAKPSPFGTKSYGDGGGYKHPDQAVGQYFETKPDAQGDKPKPDAKPQAKPEPKPEAKAEAIAKAPKKPAPKAPAVAAIPSRPRPRPFAAKPDEAPAAAKKEPALASNASIAPAKTGPVPSAATVTGGDDSASDEARRDYEARLFGAAPEPRRPGLDDPAHAGSEPATTDVANLAETMGEGMLFVSLELEPQEAGALRDAVAGLGSAAAFRPDPRFQPLPGEGGSVRISGWLPASRLGDAISRPGVRRVAVERGSRPAGDDRTSGSYVVKVRVSDASRPDESIAESVRELTAAGFKLDRVLGVSVLPGAGATALVSGTMPVSRLSRALGLPGVIEISPAYPEAEPAAPAPDVRKEGFLKYVMSRGLWLVLLTALLALPVIGDAVKKGLSVFVPYR